MAAIDSYSGTTKRQRYEILRSELELERSSFISTWMTLAEHQLPRRPRFTLSDVNKGDRRNSKLIDTTPTKGLRNLANGIMVNFTNPSKTWFRVTVSDRKLAASAAVKGWCHALGELFESIFHNSNFYNSIPVVFTDVAGFSTAAMLTEEDLDDVIRTTVFPIGSYMLGVDEKGRVNTFFREFRMTVRQLISKFGKRDAKGNLDWSNFSERVKNAYEQKKFGTWVDVCHVIAPNEDYRAGSALSKYKKFASCYYEKCGRGGDTHVNEDRFLRESGYDKFPVQGVRWAVTGEDAYGTGGPGWDTLGDNKQLQEASRQLATAIEKVINPPMKGSPDLENSEMETFPGGMTFVDERADQKGFSPTYQIEPDINAIRALIQDLRQQVRRGYFEDVLLAISSSEPHDRTAREVEEVHDEKFTAFGNMIWQFHQDLIQPVFELTFEYANRQGLVPPPPEELRGVPLRIEYVSIMALAQKLAGVGGFERFANFVTTLAPIVPDVVQKVNWMDFVERYADPLVPPTSIRADDEVAKIMAAQAQAQAQAQAAQAVHAGAVTAKNLSQTDLEGNNALSALVQSAQGGAGAGGPA